MNEQRTTINYTELDRTHFYCQKKYGNCLSVAKELNFNSISEMIIKYYFDKKLSAKEINDKFNQSLTPDWIYYFLRKTELVARPKGIPIETFRPIESFKSLDRKCHFQYYDEKLEIAHSFGYKYVNEALMIMYFRQYHTYGFIAKLFGTSPTWVQKKLIQLTRKDSNPNQKQIVLTKSKKASIIELFKDLLLFKKKDRPLKFRTLLIENDINLNPKKIRDLATEAKLVYQGENKN